MFTRIKEIRKALHYNQTDFAKKLGISQSTLAMIEVNKRTFSEKHIKLICSEFNINEHWLRTGEGEMFNEVLFTKEFTDVFNQLSADAQKLIVQMSKELLELQNSYRNQNTG